MRKILFLLLPAVFVIGACEREIDVSKVGYTPRLVVNALLNNADAVFVTVSQSTNIYDSVKPAPIANANVIINEEGGNIFACSYNLVTKRYESSLVPKAGLKYTITVDAPSFTKAYATLTMPSFSVGAKSTWKDSTGYDTVGMPTGTITVNIKDNGGEQNYYRITMYYYDDVLALWKVIKPLTKDAELENNGIATEDGGILFSDASFNGKSRSFEFITIFGFVTHTQTPKFLILSENLSKEYYNYYRSLKNYRIGTGAFVEPVPVFTNITNGIGIFAGSSVSRDTIR